MILEVIYSIEIYLEVLKYEVWYLLGGGCSRLRTMYTLMNTQLVTSTKSWDSNPKVFPLHVCPAFGRH